LLSGECSNAFFVLPIWFFSDVEEDESLRPTYYGIVRRSPIDDDPNEVFYPSSKRTKKVVFGVFLSTLVLMLVIYIVYNILLLDRYLFQETDLGSYGSTLTGNI